MRNKRRIARLERGKIIICINPDCNETWKTELDGDNASFERMGEEIECLCGKKHWIAQAELEKLPKRDYGTLTCDCGSKIIVRWSLEYSRQAAS